MIKENKVLNINIHLFIAVTCAMMSIIDVLLAIDKFDRGQYYGIIDVIFAVWFGYMSFIKWRDYKNKKERMKKLTLEDGNVIKCGDKIVLSKEIKHNGVYKQFVLPKGMEMEVVDCGMQKLVWAIPYDSAMRLAYGIWKDSPYPLYYDKGDYILANGQNNE